ncbi:MAG: ribonuclease P protein component [Hyphomicrobiaceae bacterium]|nr:ribonuclease P protein component [Hyphomicrobiaceae bacterium]
MVIAGLKKRKHFKKVRGGRRYSTAAFLLECKIRQGEIGSDQKEELVVTRSSVSIDRVNGPRFGFIVTKKLGNATVRNRIKRRLKAVLADVENTLPDSRCDYVVLARQPALDRKFKDMVRDMRSAFVCFHHLNGSQGKCMDCDPLYNYSASGRLAASARARRPSNCDKPNCAHTPSLDQCVKHNY